MSVDSESFWFETGAGGLPMMLDRSLVFVLYNLKNKQLTLEKKKRKKVNRLGCLRGSPAGMRIKREKFRRNFWGMMGLLP